MATYVTPMRLRHTAPASAGTLEDPRFCRSRDLSQRPNRDGWRRELTAWQPSDVR